MLSSHRRKKQCHVPENYKRLGLVELGSQKEFSKLCKMNFDLKACLDAKTTRIKEFHGPVQDSSALTYLDVFARIPTITSCDQFVTIVGTN